MRPATALIGVSSGRSPGVGSMRLVGDAVDAARQHLLAELLRRREVEVGEQQQVLAHQRELGRDRLLDLDDHVAAPRPRSRVATIFAPGLDVGLVGDRASRGRRLARRSTVWPCDTRIATPDGVMPTRNSCVLISLGTPMRIGLREHLPALAQDQSRDGHEIVTRRASSRGGSRRARSRAARHSASRAASSSLPWHFLYFLPEPHGHGSLRPTLGRSRRTGSALAPSPSPAPPRAACAGRARPRRFCAAV